MHVVLNEKKIVSKYLSVNNIAATAMGSFVSRYQEADWAREGGDPCVPASWSWVQCNSDQQPRVVSMY